MVGHAGYLLTGMDLLLTLEWWWALVRLLAFIAFCVGFYMWLDGWTLR